MLIDGTAIAKKIRQKLKEELSQEKGRIPCLVMILVGSHPSSQIYVNRKGLACQEVGMKSVILELPATISEQELLTEIIKLNEDSSVDGILVQLPLPAHINPTLIMRALDPTKDVDGFHPQNMGKLLIGDTDGFAPCTPLGVKVMLQESGVDLAGKHVVILGRSNIVGKPLAALLMQNAPHANATVTIAHSKTANLTQLCQTADVLVAAMGVPKFVTASMVKKGAIVIDVGITKVDGKLYGDVDFDQVKDKCALITPVPGGVGPMTIAMLLSNTWQSYQRKPYSLKL